MGGGRIPAVNYGNDAALPLPAFVDSSIVDSKGAPGMGPEQVILNFDSRDPEPKLYTVSFAPHLETTVGGAPIALFYTRAHIKWRGGGGRSQEAWVDADKGSLVSVNASAIDLMAAAMLPPLVAATTGVLKLGAIVGLGQRSGQGGARVTSFRTLAGGANLLDIIPPFATSVLIFRMKQTGGAVDADMEAFRVSMISPTTAELSSQTVAAGVLMTRMEIPNGAFELRIFNQGADQQNFYVVYGLNL